MLSRWRSSAGVFACLGGLTLLLAATYLRAEDKPTKNPSDIDQTIIKDVKEQSQIEANILHLSDVIGPRMTGSENLKRANEWAADKFRSYGLEEVKLEPYEIPAAWERGFAHMKLIEPNNGRHITAASMAWTPGTNGKITGEVVYIEATNQEELNKYKGKLKNAIILSGKPSAVRSISEIGQPRDQGRPGGPGAPGGAGQGRRRGEGQPPGKDAEKAPPAKAEGQPPAKADAPPGKADLPPPARREVGQQFAFRNVLQEFLKTEGAACMLRDSAKPHGLLVMTGSWRGTDRGAAAEPLPSLFITHEHYMMLYRLATRKDGPAPKAELEIQAKIIPGPVTVYNTVGEIRGTEKPDEYVVLGAHLDSWDLAQGTTDNGTGSCVVLESARVLGKLAKEGIRPKRTIRFVLFSGEEQGLHGSRAYVTRHKDEMAKTSMALVHDTGTGKVTAIQLQGQEKIKPIFETELTAVKELGVEFTPNRSGGTDHLSFDNVGVPGFAFRQDPSEYYLTHHTQSDTFDKAKIPDLIQGSQVMAVTAMRVANLPDLLPRNPPRSTEARPGGGGRRQAEEKKTEEKKPPG